MIKKILWIVALLFLMNSCAEVGFTKLGAGKHFQPETLPLESIQVFISESDVPGEFDKIGIVTYRGWQANEACILSWLKLKTLEEGGNAIILRSIKPKGLFTYSYGTGEAIAIKIKTKGE